MKLDCCFKLKETKFYLILDHTQQTKTSSSSPNPITNSIIDPLPLELIWLWVLHPNSKYRQKMEPNESADIINKIEFLEFIIR